MRLLYDICFSVFGLFYSPFFFLRLRQSKDPSRLLAERRGFFSQEKKDRLRHGRRIWLHAVSVGEVMAVRRMAQELLERNPDLQLFISTVTPTGQSVAQQLENSRVCIAYAPFDIQKCVERYLETVRPEMLLVVETEIWPNLILECKKRNVPVGIVNARLSLRSYRRYDWIRFAITPVLRQIDFILTQTEEDRKRFIDLGACAEQVIQLGNMKFDIEPTSMTSPGLSGLKAVVDGGSRVNGTKVIIAGSTHEDEEKRLIRIYSNIRKIYPELKLILAPRHIDRAAGIEKEALTADYKVVRSTQNSSGAEWDILLVDQLGILKNLYAEADVVFIGGSLMNRGGQNPIEAAIFAKPVIHGPHIFNFSEVYRILDQSGGAFEIRTDLQLEEEVLRLLRHEDQRKDAGRRAYEAVHRLQGATRRHLDWIAGYLQDVRAERKSHVHNNAQLFSQAGTRV